mmetsp:Transcript_9412/g.13760  ORF Transcript_9412/g.13760 Transcript_9412/m.13760 type:complete len:205 (+) Transcript_9412:86-700(+)
MLLLVVCFSLRKIRTQNGCFQFTQTRPCMIGTLRLVIDRHQFGTPDTLRGINGRIIIIIIVIIITIIYGSSILVRIVFQLLLLLLLLLFVTVIIAILVVMIIIIRIVVVVIIILLRIIIIVRFGLTGIITPFNSRQIPIAFTFFSSTKHDNAIGYKFLTYGTTTTITALFNHGSSFALIISSISTSSSSSFIIIIIIHLGQSLQ